MKFCAIKNSGAHLDIHSQRWQWSCQHQHYGVLLFSSITCKIQETSSSNDGLDVRPPGSLQESILQFPMVLLSRSCCGNLAGWLSLTFLWLSRGLAGLLLQLFTFHQGNPHAAVLGSRYPQEKSSLYPNMRNGVQVRWGDTMWPEQYRNHQGALPVLCRQRNRAGSSTWMIMWMVCTMIHTASGAPDLEAWWTALHQADMKFSCGESPTNILTVLELSFDEHLKRKQSK